MCDKWKDYPFQHRHKMTNYHPLKIVYTYLHILALHSTFPFFYCLLWAFLSLYLRKQTILNMSFNYLVHYWAYSIAKWLSLKKKKKRGEDHLMTWNELSHAFKYILKCICIYIQYHPPVLRNLRIWTETAQLQKKGSLYWAFKFSKYFWALPHFKVGKLRLRE